MPIIAKRWEPAYEALVPVAEARKLSEDLTLAQARRAKMTRPKMTIPTYRPTTGFVTPPEEQGQIFQRSYALDAEAEVILCLETDYSDGSKTIIAYQYPDDGSEFEPWNVSPSLGRLIGPCTVTQDDQ